VRRTKRFPLPPAWLVLLAILASTLPLAAFGRPQSDVALAAAPKAPETPQPPKPAPPPPPIESRIRWRESIAHGAATAGWLTHGVQLPIEGPGFYSYSPYTQEYPNTPERRYGTAELVRHIIATGKWWNVRHPTQPRLGIGDLSRKDGGRFDGHASHQNGLDVDIRLPRRDGREGPANPGNYDRELTQELINFLLDQGATYIFYGPNLRVSGPPSRVMVWPNHDDHLHVRFANPDG
jgi:hypothetical protein